MRRRCDSAPVPRMRTVVIALVSALLVAGCGDDDAAKTGATTTVAATTTPSGSTTTDKKTDAQTKPGTKTSATKKSSGSKLPVGGTKTTAGAKGTSTAGSRTSSGSKSSGSKKSSGSSSGSTGSAGNSDDASDDSVGTSNSREDRLVVVSVVRRYQKAFIEFDGKEACSLLTAAGQKAMTSGARSETCPSAVLRVLDQATPDDLKLLETTRDGITTKDVTIRNGKATVDIGKGEKLRLEVVNGKWRISDPSP